MEVLQLGFLPLSAVQALGFCGLLPFLSIWLGLSSHELSFPLIAFLELSFQASLLPPSTTCMLHGCCYLYVGIYIYSVCVRIRVCVCRWHVYMCV